MANRRADDAERVQKDLQAEGTHLLRSLDEMRPKIVELTAEKVDLMEKVNGVEHELKSRDAVIAQLENAVGEIREQEETAQAVLEETIALREKEKSSAQKANLELQNAYTELQAEFEAMQGAVKSLEAERATLRQSEIHQREDLDRLSFKLSSLQQSDDSSNVRRELEDYKHFAEEQQGLLDDANDELEALRAEIASKVEEIERLNQSVSIASTSDDARSLDDEMLSAVKQQYSLDLSTAQSRIRTLESSVFEAQATSHNLQKQVNILEDQLAQSRRATATPRPFSPGIPSRPSSRGVNHTDLRRASFGHKSTTLAPSRSVFDVGLSPETRHKRQVSLSMLKARIDSEMAAVSVGSHPSSRAISPAIHHDHPVLSTIPEPDNDSLHSDPSSFKRLQFMDDSH
ncbi:hypothetical protein SERLA73DRAFT_82847, partial [Serpula lacrymans var. lacrymans S7.3]